MAPETDSLDIRTHLSLEPLLDFWRNRVSPRCPHMAAMFNAYEERIRQTPVLQGVIPDSVEMAEFQNLLMPLMGVAFPSSTWDTEIAGAMPPFSHRPFYFTPTFGRLLMNADGELKGRLTANHQSIDHQRRLRAHMLILEKIYGISKNVNLPMIRILPDVETGLDRYFRITPDLQFVHVASRGTPPTLSEEDRTRIRENITDGALLNQLIPLNRFEFLGFVVIRAVDVTEPAVISALERDLIDQESIFSIDGFRRLQHRLRTLFGRPELRAGMGALQRDRVLVINDGFQSTANCLFRNSRHMDPEDVKDSVWLRAVAKSDVLRIADLTTEPNLCPAEQQAVSSGARSMLIAPLKFQGDIIGTFQIMSPVPGDLGPMEEILVRQIAPIFSVALKRGLDELNNEVQSIIKEKCTALHPSVEWRFRKAAVSHMERIRNNEPSEMEPIVFKDVISLFGQADIRGSSEARIRSIQEDLTEQLTLAGEIMQRASESRAWPLLHEFEFRIEERVERIRNGLSSEEESSIVAFLRNEVEPAFDELRDLGPLVVQAIENYRRAIDPTVGMVFRKRKAFEESVAHLNERLSGYLDEQQAEAQKVFPHYFEKHQTDGLDYMIYLGASMTPTGTLNPIYIRNLSLWQLIVACGMAWHTAQIRHQLKVPLDVCHLILYNRSPFSIRFRYDEKRFDVDGAYDVRHEIVKARLDKAVIKGGRERLTQPDRIAIVYARPAEGRELQRHIEFLQREGHLLDDVESIDLEDLPGVRGLRALRVGVNLEAKALPNTVMRLAG